MIWFALQVQNIEIYSQIKKSHIQYFLKEISNVFIWFETYVSKPIIKIRQDNELYVIRLMLHYIDRIKKTVIIIINYNIIFDLMIIFLKYIIYYQCKPL